MILIYGNECHVPKSFCLIILFEVIAIIGLFTLSFCTQQTVREKKSEESSVYNHFGKTSGKLNLLIDLCSSSILFLPQIFNFLGVKMNMNFTYSTSELVPKSKWSQCWGQGLKSQHEWWGSGQADYRPFIGNL